MGFCLPPSLLHKSFSKTLPNFPSIFLVFQIPHNQEEASDKMPPSVVKESRGTTGAVFPVPPEIRPVLCEYRFEVLFWGLRGLKRINLFKVEKPKVIIEVGNSSVVSETILDMDRKPNFNIPVKIIREIVSSYCFKMSSHPYLESGGSHGWPSVVEDIPTDGPSVDHQWSTHARRHFPLWPLMDHRLEVMESQYGCDYFSC